MWKELEIKTPKAFPKYGTINVDWVRAIEQLIRHLTCMQLIRVQAPALAIVLQALPGGTLSADPGVSPDHHKMF